MATGSVRGASLHLDPRWYRPVALGLTAVLLALAGVRLLAVASGSFARDWGFGNGDLVGYTDGARRFLETGSPFTLEQLSGPWVLGPHSFIHPPAALPLFLPFLVLPWILWWLIPLAVTAFAILRLRPAMWAWPLMALCLCWPRSAGAIVVGNTDIWVMAFLAAGAWLGWPLALLVVKPTFAPLAIIGIRRRSAWLAGAAVAALSLVALQLWIDWLTVIRNAGLSPGYSLLNLPLVLIPVIAYLARTRTDDGNRSPAPKPWPGTQR